MERPLPKPKKKKSGRSPAIPDLLGNTISESHSTSVVRFAGTENPRYLRALHALLLRPVPREHLDRVAGCSNGPDLIANLRDLGLGFTGLPCSMIDDQDQDGRKIKRGIYHLAEAGRRAIHAWLRSRDKLAGD